MWTLPILWPRGKPTRVDRFLAVAWEQLGRPYIWGGDDPGGFDCSGLVCECLRSVGILKDRDRLTAHGLMLAFDKANQRHPHGGCLLFRTRRDGHATHVTICLDNQYHIGASGGGSDVDTEAEAWEQNAFVKLRPLPVLVTGIHILVDPFKKG